jgi:zeta-carotene desaturase
MSERKQVCILGAGLSGLAAAVALAAEGFQIRLLERRPFPGGRASSYPVPARGYWKSNPTESEPTPPAPAPAVAGAVDNCQHILLRCCNNLLDFYARLGVQSKIRFFDRFLFLDEQGNQATLASSRLPAPLHLFPSFLGFSLFDFREKAALLRALGAMLRAEKRLADLDNLTMLEWLRQQRQPPRTLEYFWRPILVSALNEDLEKASARYSLKVILDGMLKRRASFHMGVPQEPLAHFYATPALEFLAQKQARVEFRMTARQLLVEEGRIDGIRLHDGSIRRADYYISTVPPGGLLQLLPPATLEQYPWFLPLGRFSYSPTIAIHLWFDRVILRSENVALLGRGIHWVFSKSGQSRFHTPPSGHGIGLVISASRQWMQWTQQEILETVLAELQEALPEARAARLLDASVIKEPFATFSVEAGCDQYRPDQESPIRNLFLGGDWTRTGWPATMEGAVRSGYRCAELVFRDNGIATSVLKEDLPPEWLARWLIR